MRGGDDQVAGAGRTPAMRGTDRIPWRAARGAERSRGRRSLALPLACAALLLGVGAPAAAEDGPETWFSQSVTQSGRGVQVFYTWSKGRRLRAETAIGGNLLVTLVNGDTYYNINATTGTGIAIGRSPRARADDEKGERPFGHDARKLRDRGAEKADTERVGGRALDVWRLTSATTREEIWVTQDEQQLPVKMQFTDKSSGETGTTFFNWDSGLAIADSFFEPDPRVELERIGYAAYVERSQQEVVGPFPPLFADLLHGTGARGAKEGGE